MQHMRTGPAALAARSSSDVMAAYSAPGASGAGSSSLGARPRMLMAARMSRIFSGVMPATARSCSSVAATSWAVVYSPAAKKASMATSATLASWSMPFLSALSSP